MPEPQAPSCAESKRVLRRELRGRRDQLAPRPESAEAAALAAGLVTRALALPELRAAGCVALYARHGSELDAGGLDAALRERGAAVCYPRVVTTRPPVMRFHRTESVDALVPTAGTGLREPAATAAVATEVDVFIVPGLGFDPAGHRIGYGGGFYDAALAEQPAALRIAVGYDFQVLPVIPFDERDEQVDVVLTPTRCWVTAARSRTARADKESSS